MDKKATRATYARSRSGLVASQATNNQKCTTPHRKCGGGAGFNAANIAEEICGAIKEAMAETIAQAIEYKMAERESNDSEHANLLVLLAKQNKSQRKEIETLTQAINGLKQEVKNLQMVKRSRPDADDNKENAGQSSTNKKGKPSYT